MRFDVTRKAFPLGSDFVIRNADGTPCYFIDGRAVSLRNKMLFLNMEGELLALIRRKLLAVGATFVILRRGNERARIRRRMFPMFAHRFEVATAGDLQIVVRGDFRANEFQLRRRDSDHLLARVSSRWDPSRASYGVEMDDEADEVLILATCAVIDLVLRDEMPR